MLTIKRHHKDDPTCVGCNKTLPIGVGWNRKYCNLCQAERIKKYRKKIYQTKLKKKRKLAKHTCIVCAVLFEYTQKQNVTRMVCPKCVDNFYGNLDKLKCIFCGCKLGDKSGREKFVFCSSSCAKISWYLRRRRIKMQSLLNSPKVKERGELIGK